MPNRPFSRSNGGDKVWKTARSDFPQNSTAGGKFGIFGVDKRKEADFLQGSEAADLKVGRNHQNLTQGRHLQPLFTTQPPEPVMVGGGFHTVAGNTSGLSFLG